MFKNRQISSQSNICPWACITDSQQAIDFVLCTASRFDLIVMANQLSFKEHYLIHLSGTRSCNIHFLFNVRLVHDAKEDGTFEEGQQTDKKGQV